MKSTLSLRLSWEGFSSSISIKVLECVEFTGGSGVGVESVLDLNCCKSSLLSLSAAVSGTGGVYSMGVVSFRRTPLGCLTGKMVIVLEFC